MTATTSKWGDLLFTACQRVLEAVTSRTMWCIVAFTIIVAFIVYSHVQGKVSETFANVAMGMWVAAFFGASAKRASTMIASMKNGGTKPQ